MKILNKKSYDPTLIEDPAPFTVGNKQVSEVRIIAQEFDGELPTPG